jgi:hypothetical protein
VIKRRRTGKKEKKIYVERGKDRKHENCKGHTRLQRQRTDMMKARRTGMMTDMKRRNNDKEQEGRHNEKEKKRHDDRGKDMKHENCKGHTWLQRNRTGIVTGRRTGLMSQRRKGRERMTGMM